MFQVTVNTIQPCQLTSTINTLPAENTGVYYLVCVFFVGTGLQRKKVRQ